MSEFMDRARAEAEQTIDHMGEGVWTDGVRYGIYVGVASASEQEPTDEEVEAAAYELYRRSYRMTWVSWDQLRPYVKTPFRSAGRAALRAAQKVRAGR